MTITEKSAYLKGLAAGLSVDKTTPEGQIIDAMVNLMDDMAQTIYGLEEEVSTLNDYIEEIDEDLGEVEEYLIDDDEDDECGCGCEDEDEYYEAVCPSCGETVCFDDSIDEEDLVCPACGKHLTEDDADACDCGCTPCTEE